MSSWRLLSRRLARKGAVDRAGIRTLLDELESLNGSTEAEFLGVGEKLMEFRAASREISTGLSTLTERINGAHGTRVEDALNRILDHSRAVDSRVARSGEALNEVRVQAARIRGAFSGLRPMVSTFRTICTLTRIEISRLREGTTDFFDLTEEVQPLTESIQAGGEGVLATCARLESSVRATVKRRDELRAKQLKGLAEVMAEVSEGLRAFEERRERASVASVRQAEHYDAIGIALDGVVHAIQFHDITRQQLEHVSEALRPMTGAEEMTADAAAVLRLQSSQTARAGAMFTESAQRLKSELRGVAGRVQEMARASQELTGSYSGGRESFFLQMETHFTAILKVLDLCTEAEAEADAMAAPLSEAIARMQEGAEEMRGIEYRIQRIATNASVRAAHLGRAGDALDVIAGAMLRLALESNLQTETVTEMLAAMRAQVQRGAVEAVPEAAGQATELAGEVRRTVMELHSASEASFGCLHQIVATGSRLADEIASVCAGFTVDARFSAVTSRACAELAAMAAACGGGTETAASLDDLAARYTMQVEREVHASATGAEAQEVEMAGATPQGEADDFGANIELF
ncbi:MAG: hypothetical protein ABI759_25890 [Candidatus Solibacter sp.]